MQIEFQHKKVCFSVTGRGQPIVLLHGFLEDKSIWNSLTKKLSRFFKIISIDLPGHGKTEVFSEIHTMEAMADMVAYVLKSLDINNSLFAGHSMGGYVALALIEKYPEVVEGLVLVNSNPWEDSPEKRNDREKSIAVVNSKKNLFITNMISNLFENPNNFEKQINHITYKAYSITQLGITAALKGMKVRKDRTNILKQLSKKLIITGIKDVLIPYDKISKVASETHTKLLTTKGKHMSFIEDEATIVETFIQNFS